MVIHQIYFIYYLDLKIIKINSLFLVIYLNTQFYQIKFICLIWLILNVYI